MEELTIVLGDGTTLKAKRNSYVVQVYSGGKWKNLAVFEPTDIGRHMATSVAILIRHSRVEQFM